MSREAMKLALEALEEGLDDYWRETNPLGNHAITALKQALEQPEPEPVAWLITDEKINSIQVDSIQRLIDRAKHAHMTDIKLRINGQDEWYQADWLKHMTRTSPTKPEPVAWAISYDGETPYTLWDGGDCALLDIEVQRHGGKARKMPLYTSPPETAELLREIAALSANALDDYKMIQSLMAEREPEPVALGHKEKDKYEFVPTAKWFGELPDGVHHLYTSPPKREPPCKTGSQCTTKCMECTEPEPVAWTLLLVGEHTGIIGKAGETFESHPKYYKRVDVYTSPPKREPEPVIDKSAAIRIATSLGWTPQRKPLTDEEIDELWDEAVKYAPSEVRIRDFARAIEAAHGIEE